MFWKRKENQEFELQQEVARLENELRRTEEDRKRAWREMRHEETQKLTLERALKHSMPFVRVKTAVEKNLMDREEVRYRLGAVDENDPLWVAVRKVIVAQIEAEMAQAHGPGLSDSDRQYAVGAVAGVERALAMLSHVREEARAEAAARREAA